MTTQPKTTRPATVEEIQAANIAAFGRSATQAQLAGAMRAWGGDCTRK